MSAWSTSKLGTLRRSLVSNIPNSRIRRWRLDGTGAEPQVGADFGAGSTGSAVRKRRIFNDRLINSGSKM
jgi:hypothetical protein